MKLFHYLFLIQERFTRIRDTSGMMLWVPKDPVLDGLFAFFWKIIIGGASIRKLHWSYSVRDGYNTVQVRHDDAPRCFLLSLQEAVHELAIMTDEIWVTKTVRQRFSTHITCSAGIEGRVTVEDCIALDNLVRLSSPVGFIQQALDLLDWL